MLKKIIQIDDFLSGNLNELFGAIWGLRFEDTQFGPEIPNFQMVTPDMDPVFSRILGEEVTVDEERSGVFRKPKGFIHFEEFASPYDWVLAVAVQETTFNVFENKDGSKSALDKYDYNYRDLFQWDLKTNLQLYPNNCVFFRPWLFHSFIGGITHLYYLKGKEPDGV